MIGERQHAAGDDACGAGRGGGDDHTHGGGALEHGHRAGHGFSLNGAHQACVQIVAAGGIDEFGLAADKPAERSLRIGDGGRGLLAHDVEHAAHGCDSMGLASQTYLAHGHDGADVHTELGARIEQLLAVVEDLLGRDAGGERRGRARELDKRGVIDIVELAQHGDDGVVGSTVGLKDGISLAAHLGAVGAAEGDVDVGVGEQVRERGEHAGDVLVRHKQCGIHARDVDADAVDAADAHLASAQAFAADLCRGARVIDHVDVDGVGVDGGVVALDVKVIVEVLLAREVKGLLDVLVVGIEAQDTRDERAVGAVAAVGMGKGVPQAKGDLGDAAFQQASGNLGAAQGAGGVRRAGADHDGAQDLECRGRS